MHDLNYALKNTPHKPIQLDWDYSDISELPQFLMDAGDCLATFDVLEMLGQLRLYCSNCQWSEGELFTLRFGDRTLTGDGLSEAYDIMMSLEELLLKRAHANRVLEQERSQCLQGNMRCPNADKEIRPCQKSTI